MMTKKCLRDANPITQRRNILIRSFAKMLSSTFLVLVFTDATVDTMADIAYRLRVEPFYVAFLFAPFAANFAKVLSSYSYARKKTQKTITVSLTTLLGAAIFNTFVLSI